MTLCKFAKTCDQGSEECNLHIRISELSGNTLIECTFGELSGIICRNNMSDYTIVEIKRGNLSPEDIDKPLWNKSMIISVI